MESAITKSDSNVKLNKYSKEGDGRLYREYLLILREELAL